MKRIHLSIPQPCHENWDGMTEVEKGRFCNSCQKTVIDFSKMSDRQLAEFFRKPKSNLCGHFYGDQLDREIDIPKKRIPWIKYFFQITWPALVFALKASGQTKGKIKSEVSQTSVLKPTINKCSETDVPVLLMGKLRNAVGEKQVTLGDESLIRDTKQTTVADTSAKELYDDAIVANKMMDEVVVHNYKYQGGVRCSVSGGISTVSGKTQTSEKILSNELSASLVYPNPIHAGSELTVSIADIKNADEIRIVSSAGQVLLRMKEDKVSKQMITIPSHFAAGVYFVQIVGREKILKTSKLVVVK